MVPIHAFALTRSVRRRLAFNAAVMMSLLGQLSNSSAQSAPAGARADPLDAQAIVPPLVHSSALSNYRRLTDVPVGSWRDANDTVTRIGGWRAYAREASQPGSPPSASPAVAASAPASKPAQPAMPEGRDGHKLK